MQPVGREGEDQGVVGVAVVVEEGEAEDRRLRAAHEGEVGGNQTVFWVLCFTYFEFSWPSEGVSRRYI